MLRSSKFIEGSALSVRCRQNVRALTSRSVFDRVENPKWIRVQNVLVWSGLWRQTGLSGCAIQPRILLSTKGDVTTFWLIHGGHETDSNGTVNNPWSHKAQWTMVSIFSASSMSSHKSSFKASLQWVLTAEGIKRRRHRVVNLQVLKRQYLWRGGTIIFHGKKLYVWSA